MPLDMLDFPYPSMVSASSPRDSDDVRRLPQPGELWSLWEVMKVFGVSSFAEVGDELRRIRYMYFDETNYVDKASYLQSHAPNELKPEFRKALVELLVDMSQTLAKLDVPEMERFLRNYAEDDEIPPSIGIFDTLCKAFWDGLSGKQVYFLSRIETEFMRNSHEPFGNAVTKAFKGVRAEIESASRCLAFGSPTAAVFHLMRAMEMAVNRMAEHLKADVKNDDWGGVTSALNAEIDKMDKGPARQRWSEAMKNLWHVKEAVRNEVMHPRKEGYTQDQAEENFRAVKTFMTQMASLMTPPASPPAAPIPGSKPMPIRRP